MTDRIHELSDVIKTWADEVYPDRTPESALIKLVMEEIPELLNGGLDSSGEWADLLILVVDAAHLRGIDVVDAAFKKMEINKSRNWFINPKTGVMRHIDDEH